MNNSFTILFALRHPYTGIEVEEAADDKLEISVEINDHHAGVLTIPRSERVNVILQLFANNVREVGFLQNGEVTWIINPNLTGIEQVIDAFGHVHEVNRLKEAN